jgi:V/A-type H+-transporting ATPase subunit B
MHNGIGKGKTREDHSDVSSQLYAAYSRGMEVRDLMAVVGEESLSDLDKKYLDFADKFENQFVKQDLEEDRSIKESLTLAWKLLALLPKKELKRVDEKHIEKYHPEKPEEQQPPKEEQK